MVGEISRSYDKTEPRLKWVLGYNLGKTVQEWKLLYRERSAWRVVATVVRSGAWYTWPRDGREGWNSHAESISDAQLMAAGAALLQGLILSIDNSEASVRQQNQELGE